MQVIPKKLEEMKKIMEKRKPINKNINTTPKSTPEANPTDDIGNGKFFLYIYLFI